MLKYLIFCPLDWLGRLDNQQEDTRCFPFTQNYGTFETVANDMEISQKIQISEMRTTHQKLLEILG